MYILSKILDKVISVVICIKLFSLKDKVIDLLIINVFRESKRSLTVS